MSVEIFSVLAEISAQINRVADGTFLIAFAIFSGLLYGGFKK